MRFDMISSRSWCMNITPAYTHATTQCSRGEERRRGHDPPPRRTVHQLHVVGAAGLDHVAHFTSVSAHGLLDQLQHSKQHNKQQRHELDRVRRRGQHHQCQ
jgi:hypothetical protein